MRIFVCAGSYLAKNEKINDQAKKLGKMLAQFGATYVQGGYDQGLMGLTLKEFLKTSRNVEFFIPAFYFENDAKNLKNLVGEEKFVAGKVDSETDRLNQIKKCDKIIVLPGGLGTLEEMIYCNETTRAKEHQSEIVIVNIDNFFEGFLCQLKTMIKQGLSNESFLHFKMVSSVDEIDFLKEDNKEK